MIQRRCGLLHDPDEVIQSKRPLSGKYGFKVGGFSDMSMPEELMQSDRDDIRDQGPTESCTGHALTDAARTACIIRGTDSGPLSPYVTYAAARIKHGDPKFSVEGGGYELVEDGGAYTTPLMQGAEAYGFAPESAWPSDPSRVNLVPSFHSLVLAHDRRIALGAWDVMRTAQDIRRAMVAECTVIIALNVTRDFIANEDGIIDRMTGEHVGGHMLALRGYGKETIGNVSRKGFDGVNSWGTGWGDGGWFFVTDEVIESPVCTVAIALRAAPTKGTP